VDPNTLTGDQKDLLKQCGAIKTAGTEGAVEAVAAVTPEQVIAPSSMAVQLSNTQLLNIRSRFAALRLMASHPGLAGLALNFGGQSLSEPLLTETSSLGVRGGGASADDAESLGKLGVWVNGNYNFGNRDQTTNEEGFDFDNKGVTLGADYRVTDQLVLGAAVGYANTNVDFDNNRGNLDRNGWAASLYSMYYPKERFYVDGIISYSANDFDQQRRFFYALPTESVARTAKANYDGDGYALSVGGGYEDNRGPLTFGGYARLGYGNLNIDSYQETEALGWNMGFDSQKVKSFTSTLGGRVLRAVSTSFGVLAPQGWVEWIHEFENNDKITGRLINAIDPSQATFTLTPDPVDKNYFRLGVGISAQFAKGRSAFIAYQGTLGLKNFSENDITAGIRLEF
jgi:outer membrane autotransporter protein